jgi:hypothetical protein
VTKSLLPHARGGASQRNSPPKKEPTLYSSRSRSLTACSCLWPACSCTNDGCPRSSFWALGVDGTRLQPTKSHH